MISGTVALTLTPALCVLILKHEHKQPGRFFHWFNGWFGRVTDRYENGVGWMIRRGGIGLLLFAGMVVITAGLWRITPGSLVPDEDQGFYISAVILPDGATLERTDKVVAEVQQAIKSNPANEDVVAFTGFDFLGGGYRNNAATIFVTQKHWDERLPRRNWWASCSGRPAISRRRWYSPSIRRRYSVWAWREASSSTSRTAARAARRKWLRC